MNLKKCFYLIIQRENLSHIVRMIGNFLFQGKKKKKTGQKNKKFLQEAERERDPG